MARALRIALVSFRSDIFTALHAGCFQAGHEVVLYAIGRSARPGRQSYPTMGEKVSDVLTVVAPETTLVLPGDIDGLSTSVRGFGIDLVVVCGLTWRLTAQALQAPRLGVINVHTSSLPRYRGPAPIQWAIRNGDQSIGVTAHWMNERIDSGSIIVQRGGIPLPEYVRFDELWHDVAPAIRDLVAEAVTLAADGYDGVPQDESKATYAGMFGAEDSTINWSWPTHDVHNLVRAFHFGTGIPGPFATVDGEQVRVLRTRLTPGAGTRVELPDGPLWIEEAEPTAAMPAADLA
ncbi:methionyl-tRNA formyltransferase [Catenulispora sp. GP43]|uniref:methionyl-tRNA formyltransferase n=1 Tax=Catenulispora sp. GP43 TaxID=3156263 RepID=UPI003517ADE5